MRKKTRPNSKLDTSQITNKYYHRVQPITLDKLHPILDKSTSTNINLAQIIHKPHKWMVALWSTVRGYQADELQISENKVLISAQNSPRYRKWHEDHQKECQQT
jgi:hypothetical protein